MLEWARFINRVITLKHWRNRPMSDAIKTIEYRDHKIEIFYDECAESPREWDNIGTIMAKEKLNSPILNNESNINEYEELDELIEQDNAHAIDIYAYSHGGTTISTSPFSCPWDSGKAGYIYVTKEKWENEGFDWEDKKKIEEYLKNEIKTLDDYMQGNIYGYVIKDSSGEEKDSCWDYYGLDYCISEAKLSLDYQLDEAKGSQMVINFEESGELKQ
jgi:hypothetical protein